MVALKWRVQSQFRSNEGREEVAAAEEEVEEGRSHLVAEAFGGQGTL